MERHAARIATIELALKQMVPWEQGYGELTDEIKRRRLEIELYAVRRK